MFIEERPITLSQASKLYPASTSTATILRHITRGVKVRGETVRLEGSRLGGRWITTADAVARFQASLTARAGVDPPPSPRTRSRSEAFLDALGV